MPGRLALLLCPVGSWGHQHIAALPVTTDLEAYELDIQGLFYLCCVVPFEYEDRDGILSSGNRTRYSSFPEAYVGLAIPLNERCTASCWLNSFSSVSAVTSCGDQGIRQLNPSLRLRVQPRGGGSLTHYDWNWDAAERDLRRAIDLSPDGSASRTIPILTICSRWGASMNRWLKAGGAIDLDPLNAGMLGHLVLHFALAHEFARAIDAATAALEIDPGAPDALIFSLGVYKSSGRFEEAIGTRGRLAHPPELLAALRTGLAAAGERGYWSALRDHELEKAKNGSASARTLVAAYARLGQEGEAVDWVERAFREREGWLVYLNVSPDYDGLRANPRFKQLVARIGLPSRD